MFEKIFCLIFVNRVVYTNVSTIVSIVQHLALHFQQWFVNTVDSRMQDLCILFYLSITY